MPHTGVTVYDLLLSCPGDVLDLKPVIEECVKSFNSSIGLINNIRVDLKHWSTDSFAQSGDKPQNILNKQFIDACDMCVALLGARFGTPTDNFDSGTEEEIIKMIEKDKQVFLYFVDRPVNLSEVDLEQYNKVKKFKKAYEHKGLYNVVNSKEELRAAFQNALSLYFINSIAPQTLHNNQKVTPNLVIYTAEGEKERLTPFHTDYQHIKLVKTQEKSITELINRIKTIDIEPSTPTAENETVTEYSDEEIENMSVVSVTKALEDQKISSKQFYKLTDAKPPVYSKVIIEDEEKSLIEEYGKTHNEDLNEGFYYLGNLTKETRFFFAVLGSNNGITYLGSDSEKEKHELIKKLIREVRKYNHIIEYFSRIDSMAGVSFLIENIGNTYDEDIDVKIFTEKGCIINIDDIPVPGLFFLEEVVEAEAPKFLFTERNNAEVEYYSDYPVIHDIPSMHIDLFRNRSEEIEELKAKYRNLLEFVFCYDIRESENEDILCFNIQYLKQNTKMYFPSFLLFLKMPKYIRYEIRSKHSPEVYKGAFEII